MNETPRKSALQKIVGDEELVYATIISKTDKQIIWRHVSSGKEVTHDITADKRHGENCYDLLDEGATYIIVQRLISKQHGGRWAWIGAMIVTPKEAHWVFDKVGFKNVDYDLLADVLEVIRTKRAQAQKKSLSNALVKQVLQF